MFCRKCGKEIPDDSEFCYKCGTEVGKEISQKVNPSENKTVSNILEKTSVTNMSNKEPISNAQDRVLLTKRSHYDVSDPYNDENTAEEETASDNDTNAYETISTSVITTPSSNAFDKFVSKTAIAARVTIIVSPILYMILTNGVLKELEETSSLYGLLEAALGLLTLCFLGACACRIVCAFIEGAREKELGWMFFITVILLVIAFILGVIIKDFMDGVFFFALLLFAYSEYRLHESD